MNKTAEMMDGTHKLNGPVAVPDIQMPVYTLYYTDECGTDHEIEKEFWTTQSAMDWAYKQACGQEGLWTGIGLSGPEGEEILPSDECWW